MQSVADAAVLTAAQEARRSNSNYATVAIEDAERNGFKAGGSDTVEVNNPPQFGIYANNSGYVEVQITQQTPLMFMRALHSSTARVTARGRGTAASSRLHFRVESHRT